MKKGCLILSLLLITFELYAQLPDQSAQPAVGWDSLKNLIRYPELAIKAEIEEYVYVTVKLDSSGSVRSIDVFSHSHSNYIIFEQPIKDAINSIRWLPEISSGAQRNAEVRFQIQFKFRQQSAIPKRVDLIIEADKPIIHSRIRLD